VSLSHRVPNVARTSGLAILALVLLVACQAGTAGETAIERAFEARANDVLVRAEGRILRVLSDDLEGSRHQRFIVELASGHTVLVSHNIDLAPRLPDPRPGEVVAFQGEYEWNDKGGVVHWTHHDPQGRHPGGWLDFRGRRYR